MTSPYPADLREAFRRLGADGEAAVDPLEETRHLTRQSLAARRFVERVGHRVRFDHGRGDWFLFEGHRWHRDGDGAIRRLWLEVLAERYREALSIDDGTLRGKTIGAIHAAGALDSAITAGLRIASSSKPVATEGDDWDPEPWLLGCENGVVDLRTGSLRDGHPEDMITRSTDLVFDASAPCPRWDRFLAEVFPRDAELIAWFQRFIGASFVATSKELVGIHSGIGNNGKSVCFATLVAVAGDYGVEIAIETLLETRRSAGAPTSDLMRLRGARLAFTSEPNQGARIKGGPFKRLATIDQMKGRELHGRQVEWDPTHMLHVSVNRLPDVDDTSDGFWRRVAVVPWPVRFLKEGEQGDGPRDDPRVKDELATEMPGILAWVVRGAVAFAASRSLHPLPAAVVRETTAYRADEDPLREFIERHLERAGDDRATTVATIHRAYLSWAEQAQVPKPEQLNVKRFGRAFAERQTRLGYPVERTLVGGRPAYRGVHVADDGDDTQPDGGNGGFHGHFSGASDTVWGNRRGLGNRVGNPPDPPVLMPATSTRSSPSVPRTTTARDLRYDPYGPRVAMAQ